MQLTGIDSRMNEKNKKIKDLAAQETASKR